MIQKSITIDLWQEYRQAIELVQHEAEGRTLNITLTNRAQAVDLTACAVTFNMTKGAEVIYNACTITDAMAGKVSLLITGAICDTSGTYTSFIEIVKTDDVLRTRNFNIKVNASEDNSSAVESRSEFTALEEALATAAALDARITQNETDISNIPNSNKIINGNFRINQKGVSGTVVLTAGQIGHDMFKAGSSGCTYTFATVENVTTVTIASGSLIHNVDGASLLSGAHTLSWVGTCQCKVNGGAYAASPITVSLTGGTTAILEFGTGTLSKIKLEKGEVATPFVNRDYGEELSLCQRYMWQGSVPSSMGNTYYGATTSNGLQYIFGFSFPVTMRTTPTMTIVTAPTYQNCTFSNWQVGADGACMRGDITAVGAYRAFGGIYRADATL